MLTALARRGFRKIFYHLQPKKEMSRVYLYQELPKKKKKKKSVCFCGEELPQKPQKMPTSENLALLHLTATHLSSRPAPQKESSGAKASL